ncbi:MAG: tubulin-like doman-containing protein [Pyrinomonadaceae bacterium]
MSYYVIGIGGTGAKCIEALTHLCAAGLMPGGDLFAVFVDPDKANGSLGRAQITLQHYANCQKLQTGVKNHDVAQDGFDLFKTNLVIARPDVWSPFGNDPQPKLDEFFRYNALKKSNEAAAHLFDVLYSPDEKTTSLNEGFRGHPSIGASIMATTLQLGGDEPWKTFRDKLREDVKNGAGAKIILAGSIFGGTGASGIPTIGRLIRDELKTIGQKNARLGSVLVLPYFSFSPVPGAALRADAENFLLNTQAALRYYYQQAALSYGGEGGQADIYDAVYLLGDEVLSPMREPSIGGRTQKNEPHFIELYGALACVDFFLRDNLSEYQMIARNQADRITWADLPYAPGSELLRHRVDQLTRFAFAYLTAYHPMLESISARGMGYRAPWYVDLLERERVDLSKALREEFAHVKEYCESFLRWLANIHTSAKEMNVELSFYNAFSHTAHSEEGKEETELLPAAGFLSERFDTLTLPDRGGDPHALSRLWERMCTARVNDPHAAGVGKFVHALYRESAEWTPSEAAE